MMLKDFEPFISKLIPTKKLMLSNAALEVLAIIAYKQPISRINIESIRGMNLKLIAKFIIKKSYKIPLEMIQLVKLCTKQQMII